MWMLFERGNGSDSSLRPKLGLHTHEFTSLTGAHGKKVFEAYAQDNMQGAYRILWHYGLDEFEGMERVS